MSNDDCLTLSIPEAGRNYFGLSAQASYDAARAGNIPTIKFGPRLKRVPVHMLEEMIGTGGDKAA